MIVFSTITNIGKSKYFFDEHTLSINPSVDGQSHRSNAVRCLKSRQVSTECLNVDSSLENTYPRHLRSMIILPHVATSKDLLPSLPHDVRSKQQEPEGQGKCIYSRGGCHPQYWMVRVKYREVSSIPLSMPFECTIRAFCLASFSMLRDTGKRYSTNIFPLFSRSSSLLKLIWQK